MASFTGVGDNVELQMTEKGDDIAVALSGTYNMTISLQVEQGSPGSGAWQEIKQWTTANATVAFTHTTTQYNQKFRLIVLVDTSGTATATLTDSLVKVHEANTVRAPDGTVLGQWSQGGLDVKGGFKTGAPTVLTASKTLTVAEHAGRLLALSAAAGLTVTLPTAAGTGAVFRFMILTTVTSNDYIIQVAVAADTLNGAIIVATDTSGLTVPTAATSDTMTMNGTTTGGVIGGYIEIEDVAVGVWRVSGSLPATGAEATPFSAAVS